jgi:hypothetical protein
MPVIKLQQASKLPGAPSQPFLSKMTRDPAKYPFLRETEKGWRVDTDDAAWGEYIKRRLSKDAPAPAAPPEPPPKPEAAPRIKPKPEPPAYPPQEMSASQAYNFQLVQKALKAEIDKNKAELELGILEGRYVEKSRMIYCLGFFQRAIIEGLDEIKRDGKDVSTVVAVCEILNSHILKATESIIKDECLDIIGGNE